MAWKCVHIIEDTGVVAEHWVPMRLEYDMVKGVVVFVVGLWVNKDAFDSAKSPIKQKFYEIPEGSQPQLAAAGKAFLAGYVRALPEMSGSEDA